LNRRGKDTRAAGPRASASGQPATSSVATSEIKNLWRDAQKRAEFENELRQRIAKTPQARKYLDYLTGPVGFAEQYVIGSLIRDAFGYEVPAELSGHRGVDFRAAYGSLDIAKRARELAKEIKEAESQTPDFGLDQLDNDRLRTSAGREQAVRDLSELPEILKLYADYFEKSRTMWRALDRIERKAKAQLESAVRDRLQREIYWRTGKHSDLRYSRLVNLAREVVGKAQIDEKALVARRRRRPSTR
jgi:hypothetical protein